MVKTPLIERMTKGGAAKTWIREVESKDRRIKRLLELKEEYLNVIDLLACEKELLIKNVEDGRYAHSVIRECHRELKEEIGALSMLLSGLVDVEFERDALKNELADIKEADRKVLAEDCAADEKHCTCAPALYRRIAELEAAFDDGVRALWEYEIEHVRDTDKDKLPEAR